MKLLNKILFVYLILLSAATECLSGEWQILGPRALGMGGANVAVANDATASHWNPGAFGFFKNPEGGDYGRRGWSGQLGVGVGAAIHEDLVEQVDRISEADFELLKGQLAAEEVTDFLELVDDLRVFGENDNRAVNVFVDTGLRTQVGRFGFSVNGLVDVSAKGVIDLNNLAPVASGTSFATRDAFLDAFTDPANFGCPSSPCTTVLGGLSPDQENTLRGNLDALGWTATQKENYIAAIDNGAAAPGQSATDETVAQATGAAQAANVAANTPGSGALENNDSRLVFKGIILTEVPLTYGYAVTPDLSIGGNLKFMRARVYDKSVTVFSKGENEDISDKFDGIEDDFVEKSNFGIDLGVLYRFGDDLRVGLVARNLNAPKFGSIKENAQIRTGLAYKPLSFVTLSADMDLTKNKTTIGSTYKSQNIAAGLELRLIKILMIRGGIYKNLAESDIGLVYTAGVGLNLWLINVDVAVAVSEDSTENDGDSIPEEARAEFALSMLF